VFEEYAQSKGFDPLKPKFWYSQHASSINSFKVLIFFYLLSFSFFFFFSFFIIILIFLFFSKRGLRLWLDIIQEISEMH